MEIVEQARPKRANRGKAGRSSCLIVLRIIGRMPIAGVAWQVLHYLEGFRRLGFDVSYVEDTGTWPYNPEQNTVIDDCEYTIKTIPDHGGARIRGALGVRGDDPERSFRRDPDGS